MTTGPTASAVLAVAAVASAVAVAVPPAAADRLRRLGTPPAPERSSRTSGGGAGSSLRPARAWLRGIRAWLRRAVSRRSDRHPAAGADAVVVLVDRLTALTRAGLPPAVAWQQLATLPGVLRPVCAFVAESVAAGSAVGPALLEASRLPVAVRGRRGGRGGTLGAAPPLQWLALALAVSERTGAPVAACLDRLAMSVRGEIAAADERAAAVAGPEATAQVLGWLPAAGILLGLVAGADPVRVLLTTAPGRLCGVAGAALWVAGRAWSRALVRAAARVGE